MHLEDFLILDDSFISPAFAQKSAREIVSRFFISGISRSGSFVMSNCVVKLTLLDQKAAQVVVRLRVIRSQANSSPVMIDRLIRFSLLAQNDAEIVMRHPATRIFL